MRLSELSPAVKSKGSRDRTVPLEWTASFIPQLQKQFGITRVGDTTRLDRTGIPTYCAMVPRSPDILGVYNGKGVTALAARVSAVMEAFERQAAAHVCLETVELSPAELDEELSLSDLGLIEEARHRPIECVTGYDLVSEERCFVPLALVRFPWRGTRLFSRTTTNGLASGNNVPEALYHALTEMIERHVWSLFHVRAEIVPRFYRGDRARDIVPAKALRFPTGDATIDALRAQIVSAGLDLRVMVLREGTLPLVAIASIVEPRSEPPMAHMGLGCSLSASHAVERALTEAVQSRVVDVQGAREDIIRAGSPVPANVHTRRLSRLPEDCWYVDMPAELVALEELPEEATCDLTNDVRAIVEKLPHHGLRRAVFVDISPKDQPFCVARIVGSDFETTSIDGRIGRLARNEFNPLRSLSKS